MYRERKFSVGIATGYGLGGREIGVPFLEGAKSCLLHNVEIRSGALTAFYPMDTQE
jgi:hypothetical protein